MKSLCIFLMLCCIAINLQATNYRHYFQKICEAELYIAKLDYEAALTVYKDVFKNYPHCFYRDAHNACVCAIKLNRQDEAFEFAQILVLYGYELVDFDKEPFEYLKNDKKLWKKFTSQYSNLRSEYLNSIDTELRKKYYSLHTNDQLTAKKWNDKLITTIKQQDSLLYNFSLQLAELVEKNGFPDWMTKKDTMSMKLHVMLRHYCGLENRIREDAELRNDGLYASMSDTRIHQIIDRAFNKGLVPPEFYASITTYWMRKDPYGNDMMQVQINIENETITPSFHFGLTSEDITQINKNRKSIGLHPINPDTKDLVKNTTWYKYYPFKEIKRAWAECDTCNRLLIMVNIADEVKEKYQKEKPHFILQTTMDF